MHRPKTIAHRPNHRANRKVHGRKWNDKGTNEKSDLISKAWRKQEGVYGWQEDDKLIPSELSE